MDFLNLFYKATPILEADSEQLPDISTEFNAKVPDKISSKYKPYGSTRHRGRWLETTHQHMYSGFKEEPMCVPSTTICTCLLIVSTLALALAC